MKSYDSGGNDMMKRREAVTDPGRKCGTIDCTKPKKMKKGGGSNGQYCSSCTLMRKRAERAGINPFYLTREQLEERFWDAREKSYNAEVSGGGAFPPSA